MVRLGLQWLRGAVLCLLASVPLLGAVNRESEPSSLPRDFEKISILSFQQTLVQGKLNYELSLAAGDRKMDLLLEEARLFAAGAEIVWVAGLDLEHRQGPTRLFLKGRLAGDFESSARLSWDGDALGGVIATPGEIFFLEPAQRFFPNAASSETLIYRSSDVDVPDGHADCAAEDLASDHPPDYSNSRAYGFQAPQFSETAPRLRELEIRLYADSHFSRRHGTASADRMISIVHQLNAFYERDLGVTVRIAGVRVSLTPGEDGLDATLDPASLLRQFAQSRPLGEADLAHLFTGRQLQGSTVGIANRGGVCSAAHGVGLSQDLEYAKTRLVLASHEIGHGLGAVHDGQGSCRNTASGFIMWPVIDHEAEMFSACSVESVSRRMRWSSCMSEISSEPLEAPIPLSPSGAVRRSRIQFRWEPVAGAQSYFVEVFDETDSKMVAAQTVSGAEWTWDQPADPEHRYRWRVAAVSDGLGERSPWLPFTAASGWFRMPR